MPPRDSSAVRRQRVGSSLGRSVWHVRCLQRDIERAGLLRKCILLVSHSIVSVISMHRYLHECNDKKRAAGTEGKQECYQQEHVRELFLFHGSEMMRRPG